MKIKIYLEPLTPFWCKVVMNEMSNMSSCRGAKERRNLFSNWIELTINVNFIKSGSPVAGHKAMEWLNFAAVLS
jgi:hypothetical protein